MPTLSRRSFVVGAGLLLAASSIALLLALILTVNVRLAALFLDGLTGAFLVVVGAAITIQTAFTKEDTHTALWVGPLILVVGALALPGAIAGWRHRAVGGTLLLLSIGCILLLIVDIGYIGLIFAPQIIPLALAFMSDDKRHTIGVLCPSILRSYRPADAFGRYSRRFAWWVWEAA